MQLQNLLVGVVTGTDPWRRQHTVAVDRPDLQYTTSVLMRTLETPLKLQEMQLMRLACRTLRHSRKKKGNLMQIHDLRHHLMRKRYAGSKLHDVLIILATRVKRESDRHQKKSRTRTRNKSCNGQKEKEWVGVGAAVEGCGGLVE